MSEQRLLGTITIVSDGEPDCAATDTCEEAAEASLEETLGQNGGTVNVTSVAVTSSDSAASVAAGSGNGLRRWLFATPTTTVSVGDSGNYYLRAGKRRLQSDGEGQTETEIEFVSSPDEAAAANPTTAAEQAALEINALANGGVADLLAELGLPADSDVVLDLKYVESECSSNMIYYILAIYTV